jgi:predicted RNase H-like nuclease (RuvC/YqgF family)
MSRGGQRQGAGRKSSWISGVKFEETVLIRVPKQIKNELLVIAHKLDSKEVADLVTESKEQEKEKLALQKKILNLEQENNDLKTRIKILEDLVTESKNEVVELSNDLVTESKNEVVELSNDLVTESKNEVVELSNDLVTESKNEVVELSNDLVTESKNEVVEPVQLDLLSKSNKESFGEVQPLNNSELAKHLKVDASNLKKQMMKGKEKFLIYSKSKDPNKIGWEYSEKEKLYYPLV